MYYNRARYYDQNIGRFNRMDPYAGNYQDPQSLHKYLYCHANPVNGIDPSGKFSIMLVIGISAIVGIMMNIGGFYYKEHVISGLDRIVLVSISISPNDKPSSWSTPQIEQELKQTMAPCFNHIKPGQGVRLELVERASPSKKLKWTKENGVKLEYNGFVEFGPGLGLAYSPGTGRTTIDISDTEVAEFAAGGVNWDILWANYLAHEQLWLSMCSLGPLGFQVDVPWAEEGEIRSRKPFRYKHATISENACREIIRSMGLKHR